MIELPFHQMFVPGDLAVIGLLIVLEGVLSIDNALVLGLLARRLPKAQQSRALTYGLAGAFLFRFVAIATAQYLLRWRIVKLLGGLYLLYVAGKYFVVESRVTEEERISVDQEGAPILLDEHTGQPLSPEAARDEIHARLPIPDFAEEAPAPRAATAATAARAVRVGFWSTVAVIELTDIAYAVDSILAAIALVGGNPEDSPVHPKLWVVLTGGMLGVILMRMAAVVFIRLLERFPRFEVSAYLLVSVIGSKLAIDWLADLHEPWRRYVDFHHASSVAFWIFWLAMVVCFAVGFVPKRCAGAVDSQGMADR